MGLDMYLYRRHYVKRWDHGKPERQYDVTVSQGGHIREDIKRCRVAYVIEEVAHWRKANQIHRWFVEHAQAGKDDCGHHPVERSQLQELLDLVRMMQAVGSTDYDEDYQADLADTERMLSAILAEPDPDLAKFVYHSS